MDKNTVLIVDDHRSLSLALATVIERTGMRALNAPTLARARESLDHSSVQCILLDLGLPDGHGLDLLREWRWDERPPVAVVSAHGEIDNAIAARQLGVSLFLDKPLDFDALQDFLLEIKSSTVRPAPRTPTFVGAAPMMRPVIRQIAQACSTDQPVVIRGESGTGKSHVAELIASQTAGSSGSTAIIHATSILENADLCQSMDEARTCLLIEHIDLLYNEVQQSLARQIDQLGSRAPRMIVTTDGEGLRGKVSRGTFDTDLYYRLQVLEINLPPLRERREDIPALVDSLLGQLDPTGLTHFDEEALSDLSHAQWNGNLRELKNSISHALIKAGGMHTLNSGHLPDHLLSGRPGPTLTSDSLNQEIEAWIEATYESQNPPTDYRILITELEGRLLRILLARYQGKQSHLARALSINRATLRKKLQWQQTLEKDPDLIKNRRKTRS